MSENLSAKYYLDNKERLQRKPREKYYSLSQEETQKSNNMVVSNTKIYRKMKNKSWFGIEK